MAMMATVNYNEVTHNKNVDYSILDPMYKWDVHFPEHISRLHINEDFHHNRSSSQKRRGGRGRARNTNRYKTQPITFDEIKEVDEEKGSDKNDANDEKEKEGLKSQFTAFSRSMDGLVPGYPGIPRKKNQPLRPSPLVTGSPTTVPASQSSDDNASKDGDISISIRVPEHCNANAVRKPQLSEIKTDESSSSPEKSPTGAVSPSVQVTSQELSAIGLTALPDLPQDSSRARRAKRRQKKLIVEEEPELEVGKNSSGTG